MRFFLILTVLLALRPAPAVASPCASDAEQDHRFAPSEGRFDPGATRGIGGLELLLEVTSRANARRCEGRPHAPSRLRDMASGAPRLLDLLPCQCLRERENELPGPGSRYLVYPPYRANPPPAQP